MGESIAGELDAGGLAVTFDCDASSCSGPPFLGEYIRALDNNVRKVDSKPLKKEADCLNGVGVGARMSGTGSTTGYVESVNVT
jgi:hypothetical protein